MPETFAVWIRRPGFLPSERLGTVVLQCHAHRPGSNTADTNVEQLSQLFPGPCFRRHSASQPVKSQNERLGTVVLQCRAHQTSSNTADANVEQLSQLFPSPCCRRHSASQPAMAQKERLGTVVLHCCAAGCSSNTARFRQPGGNLTVAMQRP